jgi:Ca2+/Na+ antiporter
METMLWLMWLCGAFTGALLMAVYLWWALATGRRVVRPLARAAFTAHDQFLERR